MACILPKGEPLSRAPASEGKALGSFGYLSRRVGAVQRLSILAHLGMDSTTSNVKTNTGKDDDPTGGSRVRAARGGTDSFAVVLARRPTVLGRDVSSVLPRQYPTVAEGGLRQHPLLQAVVAICCDWLSKHTFYFKLS